VPEPPLSPALRSLAGNADTKPVALLSFPMSGIAGVLRFDGRPVSRHELDRVANALHRYGPDRSELLVQDTIGLVHVLMRMTPEDRFDNQPLRSRSGSLMTADVRLDNRDDLLARIGVAPHEAIAWADSRVLLAAWEKLGDAVWPILRGPFAAAVWEPRNRVLTLARDHLGLNVLMWHRNERLFTFASMPGGLFAVDGVPRELNEQKFADFLVLNHADHATTVYRDIFRLPPAHVLQVTDDGSVRQRPYWSAAEIQPIKLASDRAYADGLRDCLDRAVRRQLRSAHPVGCLLTGGLDSSSVCTLTARALAESGQRLAAFTAVPRQGFDGSVPAGTYADETPYVEKIVRALGNVDAEYVRAGDTGGLAELERVFLALAGPARNPGNLGWMLAVLRTARVRGRRVLFGGLYGNFTISWDGWSQTAAHLKRGRVLTALRQWNLYYRRSSDSRWMALQKLIVEPLTPDWTGHWLDRWRRSKRIAPWQEHAAINVDFARAMGVDVRARKLGHDFHYRMRPDERMTGLSAVDYAGDWFAAEKALTGVEVRDPTADLEVVTYCLGVPPEQYLAEGIDRSLIRRAMWSLLPETVLTNRLSGLQAPDWYEQLACHREQLMCEVAEFSKSALVQRMIDVPRLERALKNWPAGGWHKTKVFQEYGLALPRAVAGARFLRWFEASN
jgi:asparagine synthase (glutamine-hydrolysing)